MSCSMGLPCIYSVLYSNLRLLPLFLRLHDLDSVYQPEWVNRLSTEDTRIYRKVPGQDTCLHDT